ncbi:hypothetical protein BSKO_13805 [Bryopsis sp. KO-2023]|nr:hypothetical protein BSKO_13805 [Bryopsis sp. KO-2023]
MSPFVCSNLGFEHKLQLGAAPQRPVLGPLKKSDIQRTPAPLRRRLNNRVLQPGRPRKKHHPEIGAASSSGTADLVAAQEVDESKQLEGPYHGKKAVVVGAGPSGSIAALRLAQKGFDVQVFEKRKNPMEHSMVVERSITFVLSPEVTKIMEDMGVEIPMGKYANGITTLKHAVRIDQQCQMLMFPGSNAKRSTGERSCVANTMLQAALGQKLPNLKIFFESPCEEIDIDAKVVRFSNKEGQVEEFPYDLLIGADGVNSCVRGAMEMSGHIEVEQRKSKSRYVSFRDMPIPDDLSDEDILFKALECGVLSNVILKTWMFWETPQSFLFYRTQNNCAQMILVGTPQGYENIKGKEREWIEKAFPPIFPEEWKVLMTERLRKMDLSTIGPITYCSSYFGPGVALVGDACHSATATLGIGVDRAILDVNDLDKALGESNGNVEEALRAYDQDVRLKVAAMQELELKHAKSNLEGRNPLWLIFFSLYFDFLLAGSKRFPKLIPKPAHVLMNLSVITPQEAVKRFNRAGWIFFGIVGAVACAALVWSLNALGGFA